MNSQGLEILIILYNDLNRGYPLSPTYNAQLENLKALGFINGIIREDESHVCITDKGKALVEIILKNINMPAPELEEIPIDQVIESQEKSPGKILYDFLSADNFGCSYTLNQTKSRNEILCNLNDGVMELNFTIDDSGRIFNFYKKEYGKSFETITDPTIETQGKKLEEIRILKNIKFLQDIDADIVIQYDLTNILACIFNIKENKDNGKS
jgi:hypothetical protein